jgi:hypothetical protein
VARIGELLVEAGSCTPDSVQAALQHQAIFGGRLGTNLLELGRVSEEALAAALARRHGVPAMHGDVELEPRAVALLDRRLADRWEVVPFLSADRALAVLARDPSDLAMLDEVAFATGRNVHAFVTPEARLWRILGRAYGLFREHRALGAPPPPGARPPPRARPPGPDLIDEAEFEALYGQVGMAAPTPAPGLAEEAILDPGPPLDEAPPPLTPELLEALTRAPGHAPPAALAPRAPAAHRDEPEPSPLTFAEAVRLLDGVSERGAIARAVLRYARSKFQRALLLTVRGGAAHGWAGLGATVAAEAVARLRLPLDAPGVVTTVVGAQAHFLGPLPKTEANVRLLKHLGGGVPGNAFLVPILALGQVVNVFYADNGRGGLVDSADLGELLILATRISQSYETLARAV